MPSNAPNDIYYFLGNTTSHVMHALPLYRKLGGTFVVLSNKAKDALRDYDIPVIAIDDKPYRITRFGARIKPIHEYTVIDRRLKATTDFLNTHARVVLFYDLFDFSSDVRLTKPKTVFLTHGNMLKNYMAAGNRAEIFSQYDYMSALGPYMKQRLIRDSGISPNKLIDVGIARTDLIYPHRGTIDLPSNLAAETGFDVSRPIISYLPTFWGASSIFDLGAPILHHVPDDFNLIFRPHPQTPQRVIAKATKQIAGKKNIVYAPEGSYPSLDLPSVYSASSAIIGDVSSVMLEAILAEKPLIFAYGSGKNRQNEDEYEAIKPIVEHSATLTTHNVADIRDIILSSINRGIDTRIWRSTQTHTFYSIDSGAVNAIAHAIRQIMTS